MEKKSIVKASVWYLISSFIMKGIGFITTPIFSRLLTQEEYGTYNNFSAWLSIISIIATLSLVSSLIRARFDYAEELYSYIGTNLFVGTVFAFFVDIILLVHSDFFCNLFSFEKTYLCIMCIYLLVIPAYDMFLCVQRFEYKYKLVVGITLLVVVSSIVLSLLLIFFWKDNLLARIVGAYLPTIVMALVIYVYFVCKTKYFKLSYIKYALPIAIPYVFHLLSGTILNSSDRTMITNICGPKDTALYSMAYNVAMVVNLVWNSMNTAYSPWLGENLKKKEYLTIKKSLYWYIGFFSIIIVIIMLVAPEILFVLGGKKYIEAKYIIPPVMAGYYYVFVYSIYVNVEQFEKKTIGMAVATCFVALLNVVLNSFFIPKYGYIAAAYTTLFCYLLLTVFHYYLVKKIHLSFIIDTRYVICLSCGITLFSGFMVAIYDLTIVRYCLFFTIAFSALIFLFRNRNAIFKYLNQRFNPRSKKS